MMRTVTTPLAARATAAAAGSGWFPQAGAARAINQPAYEPTVPPTTREAIDKAPTPPPIEEQLPGGADAADVKHMSPQGGRGHLHAAKKAGQAADTVTGEAAERVRQMEGRTASGADEDAGMVSKASSAVAEGAKKVVAAAEQAYAKVADQFGSRR